MDATVDLLHRVSRATLTIEAQIPGTHASAAILGQVRNGSGTLVDDHGTVLTANYVVVGAESVAMVDVEGRRHEGHVVAHDYATGIAVLRGSFHGVPPVRPGSSEGMELGADVFLTACVNGDERRVSAGALSSLDPFDAYWEYRLERALWTTCSNPGLGGGPVCNPRGEMVGVVALNIGLIGRATLAIPAENYFAHAADLLSNGRRTSGLKRAWIGVFCHSLHDQAVIAGVIPGSPADRAGFKPGDIVRAVNDDRVVERHEFYNALWALKPGALVEIEVVRNGTPTHLPVASIDAEEFFA